MGQLRFIYLADPMCSWCWGFAPAMRRLVESYPAIPLRLVMGGLFPGTTKPMAEPMKQEVAKHWHHVAEASGQPFDHGFFERAGFVYDTEPPSRAQVAAKRLTGGQALDFLERLQGAFYRDNRDITDPETLADIAAEHGFDRDAFLEALGSDIVRQTTARDFAYRQQLGVEGFPTLLGYDEERYRLLTMGFQQWDWLQQVVERWIGLSGTEPPSAAG